MGNPLPGMPANTFTVSTTASVDDAVATGIGGSLVGVAVSSEHLLSMAVMLVALVAGWRSKLPLQRHLLSLAVVAVVAAGGWRQGLPLGTQLGI